MNEARALEISEMQAKDIELSANANAVLSQPTQKSRAKGNCYNCGESWPHDPKAGCPARNRKCKSCHKYGHYAKFCSAQKSPGQACNSNKGKQLRGRHKFKGKPGQRVNQEEPEYSKHETLSSSDSEYTFRLETSASTASAAFASLKINGVSCKFLLDTGANVNRFNASRALGVVLQPCDTRVYAFNSCDPLPVMGKFSALVESKCSAVTAEFLVVESQTSLLGYATGTELGIHRIANAISKERTFFRSMKGVVPKETVGLRRWGSTTQKFGFIDGVDNVN